MRTWSRSSSPPEYASTPRKSERTSQRHQSLTRLLTSLMTTVFKSSLSVGNWPKFQKLFLRRLRMPLPKILPRLRSRRSITLISTPSLSMERLSEMTMSYRFLKEVTLIFTKLESKSTSHAPRTSSSMSTRAQRPGESSDSSAAPTQSAPKCSGNGTTSSIT